MCQCVAWHGRLHLPAKQQAGQLLCSACKQAHLSSMPAPSSASVKLRPCRSLPAADAGRAVLPAARPGGVPAGRAAAPGELELLAEHARFGMLFASAEGMCQSPALDAASLDAKHCMPCCCRRMCCRRCHCPTRAYLPAALLPQYYSMHICTHVQDRRLLVTIHESGMLRLWDLPTRRYECGCCCLPACLPAVHIS